MAVNTQGFGIQLATGGFSLEANTIFSSYALALAYAKSSAAYEGKVISVTSGTEKGAYIVEAIGENASLKKIGSNVDLSNYATKEELNTKVAAQDGYSLISQEKLDLIDTNATNIQNLEESFKNTGGNVDLSQINSVISEHADKIETLELSNIEQRKELADKAPKVGYAPDLKVDFAKELIGRGVAEPQEIGIIRPTGVTSIGDGNATIEKVKGKSVVYNQLVLNGAFSNGVENWTAIRGNITTNGNTLTFVGNDETNNVKGVCTTVTCIPAHKHAILFRAKASTDTQIFICKSFSSGILWQGFNISTVWESYGMVTSNIDIKNFALSFRWLKDANQLGSFDLRDVQVTDLTKMFGAGNEPTTIEEFEARKPLGVTGDYNEGEIISYDAKELKSVGFNAFNGSYAKVIGGQQYHALGTITSIGFTTELGGETTEVTLDSEGMFTPLETGYVYAEGSDICIHLTHTYTPEHTNKYQEDILQLPNIKDIKDKDGNQLFPQGLLSVGNIYDEITEKKVVKRLKYVEFNGSETWYLHSINDQNIANFYFRDTSINNDSKGICDKFIKQNSLIANTTSEGFMFVISGIYIRLESGKASTTTQFKQWLRENPINFVIELAEPIEVDLPEPLNLTYDAWDFGTEELIAEDKTTPLNADIVYQFNAVDKIRENTASINEIEEQYTTKEETNSIIEQLTNKQDTLTIEVLDNGNIRINNLEGGSKEFVSGEMLSSLATKEFMQDISDRVADLESGGISGSVEIVNDLITGGTDKALSAEMGKELNTTTEEFRNLLYSIVGIGQGEINLTTEEKLSYYINGSTSVWTYSPENLWRSSIVPFYPNTKFTITANSSGIRFALLKSFPIAGEKVSYCDSFAGVKLSGGTFETPEDCRYLFVLRNYGDGTDYTPSSLEIEGYKGALAELEEQVNAKQEQLSQPQIDAVNSGINQELVSHLSGLIPQSEKTYNVASTYDTRPGFILGSTSSWRDSYSHYIIPIPAGLKNLSIKQNDTSTGTMAYLKSDAFVVGGKADFCEGKGFLYTLPKGEVYEITEIPSDCKCLYFLHDVGSDDRTPETITFPSTEGSVKVLQEDVETLKEDVECLKSGTILPERYNTESERIYQMLSIDNHDFSMCVFTDSHSTDKYKYAKYKQILDKGIVDCIIGLGDVESYDLIGRPKSTVIPTLTYLTSIAGRTDSCFYAIGNHDSAITNPNGGVLVAENNLTKKEQFNVFVKHLSKSAVFDKDNPYGAYYYTDFGASKIRVIVLNTSEIYEDDGSLSAKYVESVMIRQQQINWFVNEALDFSGKDDKEDWSVLCCGHSSAFNDILTQILEAFKTGASVSIDKTLYRQLTFSSGSWGYPVNDNAPYKIAVTKDFSSQGAIDVIGILYGHVHWDSSRITNGILSMEFICDNGELDNVYITEVDGITSGKYYIAYGDHYLCAELGEYPNVTKIGFNKYLANNSSTACVLYNENGVRMETKLSWSNKTTHDGYDVELTNFVPERTPDTITTESCKILSINKTNRKIKVYSYGIPGDKEVNYQ